jgi:hypothetical protein
MLVACECRITRSGSSVLDIAPFGRPVRLCGKQLLCPLFTCDCCAYGTGGRHMQRQPTTGCWEKGHYASVPREPTFDRSRDELDLKRFRVRWCGSGGF